MALKQLSHFNIGVLLVILGIHTFQRSDGFNLQQWLSTHGSKYGPNKRIASGGATGVGSVEDEDDVYIKNVIFNTCPSGSFIDQEDKCVPLNDVPVASGGGGGGGYVGSFSGGGPASCQKGQYLDHHSGQCGVCPAECLGDTRSASSSDPRSVTCPHGQYLTASGQCVSILPKLHLHPPGQRQYTSNPHPHLAARSLSSPEAGCPPGKTLTPDGKCALILYPSIPGGSFAVASRSILSPPEQCPPGQSLKPDGKCALIPNPPVLTGICPPGQTPVPPYGQCAPLHPLILYRVLHR